MNSAHNVLTQMIDNIAFLLKTGSTHDVGVFDIGIDKCHVTAFLGRCKSEWKRHSRDTMWRYWKGSDCLQIKDIRDARLKGELPDEDVRYRTVAVETHTAFVCIQQQSFKETARAIVPCASDYDGVQHVAAGYFVKPGCGCMLRVEAVRDTCMPDKTWYNISILGPSSEEVKRVAIELGARLQQTIAATSLNEHNLDEDTFRSLEAWNSI
jgi:hypothetical protein